MAFRKFVGDLFSAIGNIGSILWLLTVFGFIPEPLIEGRSLLANYSAVIALAIFVVSTYWICYRFVMWRKGKIAPEESTASPSETSDAVLDEQTTAILIRLAKSDYRHTLRDQLNYIWKQVDERWHPRFLIWKNLSPVLKKLLITYKPEYDALEDFSNALDQLSDNDNKVDFDALKTLCKNRFDRLKELGFVY